MSVDKLSLEELEKEVAKRKQEALVKAEQLKAEEKAKNAAGEKEALAKISELTKQAVALIRQAEEIAKQAKVSFGLNIAYGMGGYFYGAKDDEDGYSEEGWVSSSQNC